MKSGTLKYLIEIYKPIITETEFGDTHVEWEFHYKTHANMMFNSGSRTNENNEIFYPTNRTFVVRHYVPVEDPMRIKFEDKYYQIISINPNKYYNDKEIYTELVNE